MDVTRKLLVDAVEDLNMVLKLNPLIATEFTSTLKGAALKAVEDKFLAQVKSDLVECAALIRETDILKESTINVLEAIGIEGIRQKVKITAAPETAPAAPAPNREKKEVAGEGKGKEKTKVTPPSPKKAPSGGTEKKEEEVKVKTKAKVSEKAKKAPAKKAEGIEKDSFGFRVKTKSSEAIALVASGKAAMTDIRKKFPMLSFGKLIKDLEGHGFKVKETKEGITSISKK